MEVIRRELHNEVRIIGFINTIEWEGVSLRYGIIVAEARLKHLFHSSGSQLASSFQRELAFAMSGKEAYGS